MRLEGVIYCDWCKVMTTQRIHSIEKFLGLSSDTKPTDSMVGSEFYSYDDKLTWIVSEKIAGVSQWVLKK